MKNNLIASIYTAFAEFNSGVVDNKQSSSGGPVNETTSGIVLNDGGVGLIIAIVLLLVALFVIIVVFSEKISLLKNELRAKKSNTQSTDADDQALTNEELRVVSQYRKLNEKEKQLISETINTLNNKSKDK